MAALPVDCGGASNDLTAFVPLALPAGGSDGFSAMVAEDGSYAFPYLPPGTYGMEHDEVTFGDPTPGTLSFEATADPTSADVTPGGTTTMDYHVTGATCTP
ncbi:MAG: hypothetical protein R6X22_08790 [Gemmatimonadota bacterium]